MTYGIDLAMAALASDGPAPAHGYVKLFLAEVVAIGLAMVVLSMAV